MAAHPLEHRFGEVGIAQEMVIEEIEVASWQALYLGQCLINGLCVEGLTSPKERLFVAKVADMRATSRYNDRVGAEVEVTLDEVTPDRRYTGKVAQLRSIHLAGWLA